jgi:hypothetical protein
LDIVDAVQLGVCCVVQCGSEFPRGEVGGLEREDVDFALCGDRESVGACGPEQMRCVFISLFNRDAQAIEFDSFFRRDGNFIDRSWRAVCRAPAS